MQERHLEVRPLTILAGANSSGKSSIMQPLLLLKQTLDATYDPGALLLNGPNVRFTSAEQILSKTNTVQNTNGFHVGIETSQGDSVVTYFERGKNRRLEVEQTIYGTGAIRYRFYKNMSSQEMYSAIVTILDFFTGNKWKKISSFSFKELKVVTTEIRAEWHKHQSRFTRTWMVSMMARKKVCWVEAPVDEELRDKVTHAAKNEKKCAAMLKDIHLVEAAL